MNKFTLTIFTAAALALTAYSRLRPAGGKNGLRRRNARKPAGCQG